MVPAIGVYAVKCTVKNQVINGMLNIGTNPTVQGQNISIEVNLFDFEADLYDQKIKVELIKRIRDEQKFASVDDLKTQLHKDQLFARQLFQNE